MTDEQLTVLRFKTQRLASAALAVQLRAPPELKQLYQPLVDAANRTVTELDSTVVQILLV